MPVCSLEPDKAAVPLAYIYNTSFSQGKSPDCLKSSYLAVAPIFMNGDKFLIANYRPTSLLTEFSKICETLINHRLIQHIQQQNITVSYAWNSQKFITGPD
jgi:hypothetical protein